MVIHINPNRINSSSGGKIARRANTQGEDTAEIITPAKAHVNYIPSPESLATLIRSAIAALRRGISWERGTILNLLV